MNSHETFDPPTREALDSIKVGDLVKCNEWKRSLRVKGVSENYFVMARKAFGEAIYSVCEKRPSNCTYNRMHKGYFTIGPDFWLFGALDLPEYGTDDKEAIAAYLQSWESGETQFSRHAVSLERISVKRC